METLKTKIKSLANNYLQEVISIRRAIHQYPELAFKEEKTAHLIAQKLSKEKIRPNL